ncbi:MAG: ASKHA domain-containing protein [Clostridia bacterium]|nr:ASKHA domain-containing protein [Clostridia bacterium]
MPSNKKQIANEGDNLLKTAQKANILIDGTCAGKGRCGKCKVRVTSGKISEPNDIEKTLLKGTEIGEGYRLACCVSIEDDMTVVLPEFNSSSSRKKKLTYLPKNFVPNGNIKKYFIEIESASLENQKNDVKRIIEALPDNGYRIGSSLIPKIHDLLKNNSKMTVTTNGRHIIALEKGNTTNSCYGIAFDIGTTTVVSMLWDLNEGKLIDIVAKTNPQNVFGADVISRILYSTESPENLSMLKMKIRDCFNDTIYTFKKNHGIDENHIYDATVVGNTTMSHLFLGVSPENLARSPFTPVFCDPIDMTAKELALKMNPAANVHLLSNIAGHVGSDIVGVLLATEMTQLKGLNLVIDVGTNGEILLSQDGRIITCSTAAGPAFEGAEIFQGMRASKGAIERVKIEDGEVNIEVIEDEEPIGICGSGLIDALAQMLDTGILDYTGKLDTQESAKEKGLADSLVSRLRKDKNGNEFVLAWGKTGDDVVITQKDIREVQLAKGAIYAGIKLMLNHIGAKAEDLQRIILAGAFGNYIKTESALKIGLFPNMKKDKVISVGNAAGAGACMALLSKDERKKAYAESQQVEHLELSTHTDFQTEYMNAMYFPE